MAEFPVTVERMELEALEALDAATAEGDEVAEFRALERLELIQSPESRSPTRQEVDRETGLGEAALIGAGRGFTNIGEGVAQLGLEAGEALGLADEGAADEFSERAQEGRDFFRENKLPITADLGEIGAEVAATAAPVAAATKVPAVGRLAARTGSRPALAGATGGSVAGATQFVEGDQERGSNALFGATLGGAVGAVAAKLTKVISGVARRAGRNASRTTRERLARATLRRDLPDLSNDMRERVVGDIADGLTPEQALRRAQIESIGAVPTRGTITGDLDQLRVENELRRRTTEMSAVDERSRRGVAQRMNERVEELTGAPAPSASGRFRDEAGEAAEGALIEGRRLTRAQEDDIWTAARRRAEEIDAGESIVPQSVRTEAADLVDQFELPSLAPVRARLRRMGILNADGDLIEDELAGMTIAQADILRRTLNETGSGGDANVGRVIKRLKRALERDVLDGAGENVFGEAVEFSRRRFADFDNNRLVDKVIGGRIPAERLVPRLQSAGTSARDIQLMLRTLDTASPQAGRQLRAGVLDDIFAAGRGAPDTQGIPFLKPAQLANRLESIGNRKLVALLGDEGARDVREFSRLMSQFVPTDRRVINPGTADELSRRAAAMFGRLADSFLPTRWVLGLARAAEGGIQDRTTQQKVRSALNAELLKRENVLVDLFGSGPAIPLAAGAAAGSQAQDVREAFSAPEGDGAPRRRE